VILPRQPMALVVDASVAVKWVIEEALRDRALDLLADNEVIAPDLLLTEVRNALAMRVRRRLTTVAEARAAEAAFRSIPLLIEPTSELLEDAFELALRLAHPIYDCLYLALAVRRDLPLATADRRLLELSSQVAERASQSSRLIDA
jgi:predicted nucleic acid-binding protein